MILDKTKPLDKSSFYACNNLPFFNYNAIYEEIITNVLIRINKCINNQH